MNKITILHMLLNGLTLLVFSCGTQREVSNKSRHLITRMPDEKSIVVLSKDRIAEIETRDKPTAFELYDNIDLNGKSIRIPPHSVLKFKGGCLRNGVIVGDNSTIEADNMPVLCNVQLLGTWNNKDSYISWFSSDKEDKYEILRSAFSLGETIHFQRNHVYKVQIPHLVQDLINPKNRTIVGNRASIIVAGSEKQGNLFYIDDKSNDYYLNVNGLSILGEGEYSVNMGDNWMCNGRQDAFYTSNVIGFHIVGRGDVCLRNCSFSNLLYGVRMDETQSITVKRNFTMEDCTSDETCIMPVMVHHVNRTVIKNCKLTCAKSTQLIHHLYLADCIDTILVETCLLYGGTGDPLDIYHSRCKSQIIRNNKIVAGSFSAIVLDDVDKDVHIDSCYLYAEGRGCLYGYDCRGKVLGRNIDFETPVTMGSSNHYIIHSPNHNTPLRVKLEDCSIKSNGLHSAASAKMEIEMDRCEMQFFSNATISRPVSCVEYIIRNSSIKCPNFTRFSTLFDIRNEKSSVKLINTNIERGNVEGDWLVYVDVPYKLSVVNSNCNNVNSLIRQTAKKARVSTVNSKIIQNNKVKINDRKPR